MIKLERKEQELNEEINKYQKMYLEKIKILERDCEDKDKKIRSYENDLLKYNPKLSNEEINYILNIVIYPKPNFNENENVKENN